jgi:hypothetical protein
VICLALGIGATTATWSAVSQALLRPLPFGNPDRLVVVHRITAESGPLGEKSQSPANYADLARQSRQLESFAVTLNLADGRAWIAPADRPSFR